MQSGKGNKLIDDRVQISVNLLRYKSHGETFEIAINADKAVSYKEGYTVDINEIINAEQIFTDMKKGLIASELELNTAFNTTNPVEIAKIMLDKGEIQFTQKYRSELRERKQNKIINIIHRNAINPKTGLPHPENRIAAAIEEAKIKINDLKKAEDQINDIVKLLRPIIPISIEKIIMKIHIPAAYSAKLRGKVMNYGAIKEENWLGDGGLLISVEMPAGLQNEIMDELNNASHGSCDVQNIERIK